MTKNQTLKDHLKISTVSDSVQKLNSDAATVRAIAEWITANKPRDEKSVTVLNLLNSVADFLQVAAQGTTSHISVLALATRNLFELNIRVRHVLQSDDQLKRWQGEVIQDKVDYLNSLLTLETSKDNQAAKTEISKETARLQKLQEKYNLPTKKSPPTKNLAVTVGLEKEYDALFKVFSKLVHPTSLLVNDHQTTSLIETIGILQIHAQLYAIDSQTRIIEEFSVPKSVCASV